MDIGERESEKTGLAQRQDDLEPDDVSLAPESGQPRGGRENPWDDVEAPSDDGWPPPRHATPKEEL